MSSCFNGICKLKYSHLFKTGSFVKIEKICILLQNGDNFCKIVLEKRSYFTSKNKEKINIPMTFDHYLAQLMIAYGHPTHVSSCSVIKDTP